MIILVYEANGNVDEGGGTHGIRAQKETLGWMVDHDGPYIGEDDISCGRKSVKNDEKGEVEEEPDVGENL